MKTSNIMALTRKNYLDSPIVDLEWGQPVFYKGH